MAFMRVLMISGFWLGLGAFSFAQVLGEGSAFRLTLKDALQSADSANLQVLMANARLQQAIARISQARADLLPHVEGTVNGARQTVDLRSQGIQFPGFGSPRVGPFNNFNARAGVTLALFDPSSFERFQAARKGKLLSAAELEKTREDVLALVADLFIDAQRKQQAVALMKVQLDRDQMAYDLSVDNFSQGTGTSLDVNRYKAELTETQYAYIQAQESARNACLDLEAALHLSLKVPLVLLDDNDFLQQMENDAASSVEQENNADMDVAQSQLDQAQADRNSAVADFLPQISGSANYGRAGESPHNGSNTYFVGVQATVPLWEGGSQQAKLSEAKGRIKEAQENLQDTVQQKNVNVAKARAAIFEAYDLKLAKAEKRQTFQKALMIAVHSQQAGSDTVFHVMQEKANLASAEDEFNEAQAAWVMAHIDFLHAEGRLRHLIKKEESNG